MMYLLGLILTIIVVMFLATALFLGVVFSAVVTGQYEWRYHCTQGVMEQREYYYGVALLPWGPIDGDPAGACDAR